MIGLIGLLLFAWFIASVYSFFSAIGMKDRISGLEKAIRNLNDELAKLKNKEPQRETEKESPIRNVQEEIISTEIISPAPVVNSEQIISSEIEQTLPHPEPEKIEPEKPFAETIKEEFTPYAFRPARTNAEWEAFIGGKILNRIGALALIIGVGFFLKYAFDNNWITETMRVAIGIVSGAALLLTGNHFKKKNFHIFSQGLAGSGIAILYLSVYSAFNFYHLVPQLVAMIMMSAVTAITLWQAFSYNSQVIGIFGWLGGFLTPLLLSTGEANEIGLFSYIALLDLGLLIVSAKKSNWFLIEPLSLISTIVVFTLWFGDYYTVESLWVTIGFTILFWTLFLLAELRRIHNREIPIQIHHQIVSVLNGVFFYISLYNIINPHYHKWMGLVTVFVGLCYLLLYFRIRNKRADEPGVHIRYLLSSILLAVVAASIQFEQFELTIAWSVEFFLLLIIAIRTRMNTVLMSSLGVLLLSLFSFLVINDSFEIPVTRFHFLFNERALALLILFLFVFIARLLTRNLEHKFSASIRNGLSLICVLIVFAFATIETSNYSKQLSFIADFPKSLWIERNTIFILATEWMLLSIVFWFLGRKKNDNALFLSAMVLLALSALSALPAALNDFEPIALYKPLFTFRMLSLLLLSVGLFLQSRWTDIYPINFSVHQLADFLRVALVATMFILLTVEVRDYFYLKIEQQASGYDVMSMLYKKTWKNQQQLSISFTWLAYSMLLMVIGIYRKRLNVRVLSIVLFGLTIAKVFFYDLSYLDTLHRIISFIGLGVILILVSYLYQRYKDVIGISKS